MNKDKFCVSFYRMLENSGPNFFISHIRKPCPPTPSIAESVKRKSGFGLTVSTASGKKKYLKTITKRRKKQNKINPRDIPS